MSPSGLLLVRCLHSSQPGIVPQHFSQNSNTSNVQTMSYKGQEIAKACIQLLIYPYKHNVLLIDEGSFVDTSMLLYLKHA